MRLENLKTGDVVRGFGEGDFVYLPLRQLLPNVVWKHDTVENYAAFVRFANYREIIAKCRPFTTMDEYWSICQNKLTRVRDWKYSGEGDCPVSWIGHTRIQGQSGRRRGHRHKMRLPQYTMEAVDD